jgi:hypothetical protein
LVEANGSNNIVSFNITTNQKSIFISSPRLNNPVHFVWGCEDTCNICKTDPMTLLPICLQQIPVSTQVTTTIQVDPSTLVIDSTMVDVSQPSETLATGTDI